MARFPKSEAEIAALAQRLIHGLTNGGEDFPSPPASPEELQAALAAYIAAKDATVTADKAAAESYTTKDDALDELVDLMKADIRYAEVAVRDSAEKLRQIGWSAPRGRKSLELPGQVRSLGTLQEGDGWVILDWKEPTDGGRVSAYRVRCKKSNGGSWKDAGMAVETRILLSDQERGVELTYEVVAVNKAGVGEPSNIVTAVL
jgi:hypothetical protein